MKQKNAIEYTYWLLNYRARTEKEIIDKLKNKNYDLKTIAETVEKLKRQNLINDKKFTESYITVKLNKGLGVNRIVQELYKRGVSSSVISETLKELNITDEVEYPVAEKLFYRKVMQYKGLQSEKIYRRVGGFLARRGFSVDVINKLFNRWKKGEFKHV